MSIFDRIFAAKAQKNAYGEIEVEFYKRANAHIPHGQLIVSHKGFNLTQVPVNFVFPGLTEAPPLTKRLVNDLWSAAESQGYFPHAIASYGTTVLPDAQRNSDFEGGVLNEPPAVDLDRVPALTREKPSTYIAPAGRFADTPVDLATGKPVPEFLRKPEVKGTSAPNDTNVQGGQIRFPDAPPVAQPRSPDELVEVLLEQMVGGEGEFAQYRDGFMAMPDDVQELLAIKASQQWNNVFMRTKDWAEGEKAGKAAIHVMLEKWKQAGIRAAQYLEQEHPATYIEMDHGHAKALGEIIRIFFRSEEPELNSVEKMMVGTIVRNRATIVEQLHGEQSDSKQD